MELQLLSPTGTLFSGQVSQINLRTPNGSVTILPHHAAMTTAILPGAVTIHPVGGSSRNFELSGGLLVTHDNITLLLANPVGAANLPADQLITQSETLAAQLRSARADQSGAHHAQELVDRSEVKLEVTRLRRRRH